MTEMSGMEMGSGLPGWVRTVAWIWIALSLLSAVAILSDIRVRGRRQGEWLMEGIWPLAALYLGPFGLPVYVRFGRAEAVRLGERTDGSRGVKPVDSVLSGGVASGLAHLVAVPLVVVTGLTIAGLDMWAMVVIIAVLATGLIFVFDYGRAGGRGQAPTPARTLMAAVLTVVAFDVGMLGWMLLLHYTDSMPAAGDVRFTFLMQVGLILGSLTALPLMRAFAARRAAPISSAA